MSFEAERQAIEARFAANFTALGANRIEYDNQPFRQPPSGEWVRFIVQPGGAANVSTGPTPIKRHAGVIFAQIFAKEGTGTKIARQHADAIATVFRSVQFSVTNSGTITTREPSIQRVGTLDGWYQVNVSVPYQRDVI